MTTFYKKNVSDKGRVTYVPVSKYDHELTYSLPEGAHLIVVRPGSTSCRYNIEPAFAPLIAAGSYAIQDLSNSIVKSMEAQPERPPLTLEQKEAWDKLNEVYGHNMRIMWPSARQVAEEVLTSLQCEADKLLQLPAVKVSYDKFLLVCKLAQDMAGEKQ